MFKFIKSQIKMSQGKKAEEQRKREEEKELIEQRKREEEQEKIRRIEEEKELIEQRKRKEEQEKLRIIKEEKQIKEELYNIIKNNALSMNLILMHMITEEDFVIDFTNASGILDYDDKTDIKINNDIIIENIIEIYKLISQCTKISDFNNIVGEETIIKLSEDILINDIKDYEKNNLKELLVELLQDNLDNVILINAIFDKYEVGDLAKNLVVLNLTKQIERILDDLDDYTHNNVNTEKLKVLLILVLYAKAFNKALMIEQYYKNKFIENKELYTILNNLFIEFDDAETVIEKLYPIYEKFYMDIFEDKVSKEELNMIICIIKVENEIRNSKIESSMNNVMRELDLEVKEEIQYIDIHNLLIKMVDINSDIFNDNKSTRLIINSIINILIDKISFDELINILTNRLRLQDSIFEYREGIEIEREKERDLKGDFSNEKLLNLDMETFNNIVTGEEFELYLKNFFGRLGYNVELTKATGDQGADLIIEKDLEKIVVQAKFYSTPVGNKAVQEVIGSIKFYKADKGMVVTNNIFTKSAIDLADANDIELIDGLKLNELREKIYL